MTRPQSLARPVIFDLGGVLIDWNPRYLYRQLIADERAMEEFLATVCTPAWNERQDAGRPIAEAEAELIDRFPAQAPLIRAYYGRFGDTLRGAIAGTVRLLETLDRRGVPLYALTNWSAETFPVARARFAFLTRFKDIVVSGEFGAKKPDAAIFRHLLARNGLAAEACVYIDDSPPNVAAARAVGLTAIHFRSPEALEADLRGLGFLGSHAMNGS